MTQIHLLMPILMSVLFLPASQSQRQNCNSVGYHYLDRKTNTCKLCSRCPENHIITSRCTKYSDLKCTHLKEFTMDTVISYEAEKLDEYAFDRNRPGVSSKENSLEDEGTATLEKDDQEYWKALAFALIALLSVLIVATVVVLFACCRLQRAVAAKQQEDGEIDDTDSGYVVIRTIRDFTNPRPGQSDPGRLQHDDLNASHTPLLEPTSDYGGSDTFQEYPLNMSPDNRCFLPKVYNPQRRLVNYETDSVFESDDSGGSVRFSTMATLKTIPEKSDQSPKPKENDTQNV